LGCLTFCGTTSREACNYRARTSRNRSFCIDAVEEALAKYGCPQIFNADQGSQFASAEFSSVLINNGISISMDGKGAWRDNVFVERFWRTVKYEEVYLHAYDGVGQARQSIGRYIAFYNTRRPHAALDGRTPDQAYFDPPPLRSAA
jgi:putative transposase